MIAYATVLIMFFTMYFLIRRIIALYPLHDSRNRYLRKAPRSLRLGFLYQKASARIALMVRKYF